MNDESAGISITNLSRHYQWAAVCAISEILKSHGFQALLAGGCVRDAFLGVRPQDLDVATNARPEEVEALFPKTVAVGKSFGVIRVLCEGADIEVATFREDGAYEDGRRPTEVSFSTPIEDAKRRDFTVNAMFLDIYTGEIFDYVGGIEDLRLRRIRTVGLAEQRFAEDYLRLLRAIRFSGQLGFVIEVETFEAIQKYASNIIKVSPERRHEEMTKLLKSSFVREALKNLRDSGLMKILFPFRGDDISFLDIPTDKDWKRWSVFFLPVLQAGQGAGALKEIFQSMRFSNRDRRAIELVFSVLEKPETFFTKRLGLQRLGYFDEAVRWACEVISFLSPAQQNPWQKQIEILHTQWLACKGQKPEAFLRGEDLNSRVQGPRVGQLLQDSFLAQLEGSILNREAALVWLEENI